MANDFECMMISLACFGSAARTKRAECRPCSISARCHWNTPGAAKSNWPPICVGPRLIPSIAPPRERSISSASRIFTGVTSTPKTTELQTGLWRTGPLLYIAAKDLGARRQPKPVGNCLRTEGVLITEIVWRTSRRKLRKLLCWKLFVRGSTARFSRLRPCGGPSLASPYGGPWRPAHAMRCCSSSSPFSH
jgi:hypothetical protein